MPHNIRPDIGFAPSWAMLKLCIQSIPKQQVLCDLEMKSQESYGIFEEVMQRKAVFKIQIIGLHAAGGIYHQKWSQFWILWWSHVRGRPYVERSCASYLRNGLNSESSDDHMLGEDHMWRDHVPVTSDEWAFLIGSSQFSIISSASQQGGHDHVWGCTSRLSRAHITIFENKLCRGCQCTGCWVITRLCAQCDPFRIEPLGDTEGSEHPGLWSGLWTYLRRYHWNCVSGKNMCE